MVRSVFSCSVLFALFLVLALTLTGCGGGASSGSGQAQDPETAVRALVASWKTGTDAPSLHLDVSGHAKAVFQTAGEEGASGTISFRDLSGNDWHFVVESIVRPSAERAEVRTSTTFGYSASEPEATKAYITFIMYLDEGRWYLDDLILEIPTVIVATENAIEGYLSEKDHPDTRLEGASVALYQGQTKIATTVTDANGYYKFADLPPGTYTLVFVGGGYETLTITGVVVQ